jgi:hypothetical protein
MPSVTQGLHDGFTVQKVITYLSPSPPEPQTLSGDRAPRKALAQNH